jgi:isoleucyl-tRNA synthetase
VTAKFGTASEKGLTADYRPLGLEKGIREFWEKNDVQQKLALCREKDNEGVLGYVEGPPTLNGIPHIGHARGRVMKDVRYRWKTMQGFRIPFWAGWDCQGLPVELEVERLLGVKNKRELLERIGEERFIEECKKAIMKYHREWVHMDSLLAVFIDQGRAYWTYKDEYIEREWQILKRAWDQGLLEEGHYVVAYCPGCQTSLSSAEVGYEGSYQQVEDPSLHFKFRVSGSKNEYFLVWTTMPFTLITDTMLAVRPEAEYAKVAAADEKWIMAAGRVEPLMHELGITEYKVVETCLGRDLEKSRYDYPFKDIIPKQEDLEKSHPLVHTVVCEDFVDVETATGVVHLSPGNGEEDFFAAMKRSVPIFVPFDDEVKFTSDGGEFCGVFARDTDKTVVEELRNRGLLVKVKNVRHEYPTCWRSHHKLIWLARKEYFLRTDRVNDKILEAAEKVKYYYDSPKNRFIACLKEGKPWCVSRERVWGAPLPVWKCEECGAKTLVASKKELLEKAVEKPNGHFELHKPWVDQIFLKCQKCGGMMRREDYVLDTWHNSGASFFARFTNDQFKEYVPVDFLTEAIDQTRGWANRLLQEYVIFTGKAESPFKAFLFQGLTQDAKGRKMSKSLGNVMEANKILEKYSADLCRFYMLRKCSPIDANDFDVQELGKRTYQILSTLYHLNRFFAENAHYDEFNPEKHTLERAKRDKHLKSADIWLLSRLQETIETYTAKLETSEFNQALAILENLVIEYLSRLYVPMVRKELWTDDAETLDRRLAVYSTLWQVLKTTTLLFNPVTPYLSEALHQNVYRVLDSTLAESVNLEDWPKQDEKLRDKATEEVFQTLFNTVSLAYSARQNAKLKRRWPLNKIVIVAPERVCTALKSVEDLLLELTNVKAVEYTEKPLEHAAGEGWASASEGATEVFLDIHRDQKLLGEGIMRDLARRVQALRKELGYKPTDMLDVVRMAELDEETIQLLRPYLQEMKELTRTKDIRLDINREETSTEWHESQLDEKKVYIAIPAQNKRADDA